MTIKITRTMLGNKINVQPMTYSRYEEDVLLHAFYSFAFIMPASVKGIEYTGQQWMTEIRKGYDVNEPRTAEVLRVLEKWSEVQS